MQAKYPKSEGRSRSLHTAKQVHVPFCQIACIVEEEIICGSRFQPFHYLDGQIQYSPEPSNNARLSRKKLLLRKTQNCSTQPQAIERLRCQHCCPNDASVAGER